MVEVILLPRAVNLTDLIAGRVALYLPEVGGRL